MIFEVLPVIGHVMRLTGFILSLKIWLAACLVATMLIGPASADAHTMDPQTIACQVLDDMRVQTGADRTDDGQSRPEHEHHVDACGSCHFHLVGSFQASSASRKIPGAAVWPGTNAPAPRAGPFGLYRPPRV